MSSIEENKLIFGDNQSKIRFLSNLNSALNNLATKNLQANQRYQLIQNLPNKQLGDYSILTKEVQANLLKCLNKFLYEDTKILKQIINHKLISGFIKFHISKTVKKPEDQKLAYLLLDYLSSPNEERIFSPISKYLVDEQQRAVSIRPLSITTPPMQRLSKKYTNFIAFLYQSTFQSLVANIEKAGTLFERFDPEYENLAGEEAKHALIQGRFKDLEKGNHLVFNAQGTITKIRNNDISLPTPANFTLKDWFYRLFKNPSQAKKLGKEMMTYYKEAKTDPKTSKISLSTLKYILSHSGYGLNQAIVDNLNIDFS